MDENNNVHNDMQLIDSDIASFIYNNYDNMTNDMKKCIAFKCLTDENINKILIHYEYNNYVHKTVEHMSITEFLGKTKMLLRKYQGVIGGFLLEDNEWIVDKKTPGKIILKNSIAGTVCDNNTNKFLNRIEDILNMIADNINVKLLCTVSNKNCLTWIEFTLVDLSMKQEKKIEL